MSNTSLDADLKRHIAELRRRGVTLYRIAQATNVALATLKEYINGTTAHLRFHTFARIAAGLGLGLAMREGEESLTPGPGRGRPPKKGKRGEPLIEVMNDGEEAMDNADDIG